MRPRFGNTIQSHWTSRRLYLLRLGVWGCMGCRREYERCGAIGSRQWLSGYIAFQMEGWVSSRETTVGHMRPRHVARTAGSRGRVRLRARFPGRGMHFLRLDHPHLPLQPPSRRSQHGARLHRRPQPNIPAVPGPRGRAEDQHRTSERLGAMHLRLPAQFR